MNTGNHYNIGLHLVMPDGVKRNIGPCTWYDDAKVELVGNTLSTYHNAKDEVPHTIEILPKGTQVFQYDYQNDHTWVIGVVE